MNHIGISLGDFFRHSMQLGEPLVLATVVHTVGSTYRKPGAQMLIAADGRASGLLSGGCLETDLMERARAVIESGKAMIVDYDSRSPDDVIWGIGLGCEGAMRILLSRLGPLEAYQPFLFQEHCRREDRAGATATVVGTSTPVYALGQCFLSDDATRLPSSVRATLQSACRRQGAPNCVVSLEADGATFLIAPVFLPLRLLVLGAGPDAIPLVEIAALLDWHVTVLDHRPAYAVVERFPHAQRVAVHRASALADELSAARYDAAVVMSHHLPSDEMYLKILAQSAVPYVGLLGPAPRRARLLQDIGGAARALEGRLYGPIGLDIGARTPQSIALAIVSEIHAVREGKSGRPFSRVVDEAGYDARRLGESSA